MTDRQGQFLKELIDNFVITAEPVASALLASGSKVSSATVRNDLAILEESGYIEQPHTSAGRIPTLKGYRYYLNNFFFPSKPVTKHVKRLQKASESEQAVKSIAKELAEISGQAVLVALSQNDYYYTGISKLFAQPEFNHHQYVIELSSVIDAFDVLLKDLHDKVSDRVEIKIGKENLFSKNCGLLVTGTFSSGNQGLIAILGPLRMDYNRNVGLLEFVAKTINSLNHQ